jgi:hypothetical protein
LFGNAPVVGETSKLNREDCPAATDALNGVAPIVKSKLWLGIAVKFTAAGQQQLPLD